MADYAREPTLEHLLTRWNQGEDRALDRLLDTCYRSHLLPKARQLLQDDRQGIHLEASDLIHQAWFKLADLEKRDFPNLPAFLGFVEQQMKRGLIDFVRKEEAAKRGGKGKKQIAIQKCEEWLDA